MCFFDLDDEPLPPEERATVQTPTWQIALFLVLVAAGAVLFG